MNIQSIAIMPETLKGFYPTPLVLADRLLAGIDWHYVGTVLEPSAGNTEICSPIC